ncbi:MATE family efflux transporter [Anaerobium acetethylicum]|nr:MATE family efflux transporter [Anaerobium acetethylicum]
MKVIMERELEMSNMKKSFYLKMLSIAFPVICQSIITIGINMIGTIMLGHFGEEQLSAASLANQYISVFYILSLGIGSGAAVLTAQFFGKNNLISFRKTATLMYRFEMCMILLFSAVSGFFPEKVMGFLTRDAEIIGYGAEYLRISAFSYFFFGIALTTTFMLRNVGKVYIPLISSAGAFFINIFFSWVFIFGRLGMERMEIRGAALGTLIARIFEFAVIAGSFIIREKRIGYRIRHFFQPCKEVVKQYVRYCMPVFFSDFLLAAGNMLVVVVIGHVGTLFVSAYAIASVAVQLYNVFTSGLYSSSSIMIGVAVGQEKVEEAFAQGKEFLKISLIASIAACFLLNIISEPFIGLYNVSPETVKATGELMRAVSFIVIFQIIEEVMTKGVLRGGGDTRFLMVADVLFLWILSVPLGCLAAFWFRWPPAAIYICLKSDCIVKVIWCIWRFRSRKWIHIV